MTFAFDKIAENYDTVFTGSLIGKAQRKIVHQYLGNIISQVKIKSVLELNCGTGEDTIFFAKKNIKVVATDISEKMLQITKEKIRKENLQQLCEIKKFDISNPGEFEINRKFDLIFSNFGGINCINAKSFETLGNHLKNYLNNDGRMILIIMPKYCLWESFYFLLKFKSKQIFRRKNDFAEVLLNGEKIKTYYYSPSDVKKILSKNFILVNYKPVGFFIPPSYLNYFFERKKRLFNSLCKSERVISGLSFLSHFSDHFLIELKLRK